MTDFSTSLAEPEAPELSTQLDAPRASDETITSKGPQDEKPAKEPAKESRADTVRRVAEEAEAKAAPTKSEPVKEPAKDEATAVDKAAPQGEAEGDKDAAASRDERPRKDHIEAPDKFLPRSKELWINTPREVKADVKRVVDEAHAEVEQARESVKEFEAVRPYAEMARQSGTTLDAALGKYISMERTLASNPTEGLRGLLQNMQMPPVQAIGHILSAFNIRPEQLAQHIAENPHEYTPLRQAQQQPQTPQQRQPDPQVAALEQRLVQVQEQMTASQVIEPFAAENPRYYELQEDIAFFLQSGKVPASYSPQEKLAAAYDMAVRLSPSTSGQPAPAPQDERAIESRAGDDFGGTKSVRGAPASGAETSNLRKGKMSHRAAISAAMQELGVSR